MDDVITLSSDSDEDESDVEVVGSYSNIMTKPDPLPLTAVRVYVDAVNVNVPTVSLQITTLPLIYKLAVTIVILRRRANLVDLNHCLYIKQLNPKKRTKTGSVISQVTSVCSLAPPSVK